MNDRTGGGAPGPRARTAGVFYLLTIVTGAYAAMSARGGVPANLAATACYVAVTLLFYFLFKPVSRTLSLLAAFVSLVGCTVGALGAFRLAPFHVNALVFFGIYCILIGTLIFRSTFLPRVLGALMMLGGLGWLTFVSTTLAHALSPYNMLPGILGEGALTLWLLAFGVNVPRWNQQAGASAA